MNPTESPPEPLDPNERELARVVRALPGGEPPAMLDARILKAAQDAVAAGPSRRRGPAWLLGGGAAWGIGSAAAAVLAIGIGWQVIYPTSNTQLPMPARAPAPAASTAADESAGTSVEFRERKQERNDVAPPPMPAPPLARALSLPPASPPSAPAPAPPAPPPPPPPVAAAAPAQPAVVAQEAGAINAIDVSSAESTTVLTAEQVAKLDSEAAARKEMAERDAAATASASRNTQERARAEAAMAAARAASAPPAAAAADRASGFAGDPAKAEADFQQRPSTWLAHIRELRDRGDDAGARANLADFRKRYPDYRIPSDLVRLLEP